MRCYRIALQTKDERIKTMLYSHIFAIDYGYSLAGGVLGIELNEDAQGYTVMIIKLSDCIIKRQDDLHYKLLMSLLDVMSDYKNLFTSELLETIK